MDFLFSILLSPFLAPLMSAGLWGVAFFMYTRRGEQARWGTLLCFAGALFFLYTVFLTTVQYFVWSHNEFTRLFLPPFQDISYFIIYTGGRFWLPFLLSAFSALVFWLLFTGVSRGKLATLSQPEIALGTLFTLIVGWPEALVFVVLALVLDAMFSAYAVARKTERTVGIAVPMFMSALVTVLFGARLISLVGLSVLFV